jgi:hypothetical protein
VVMRAERPQELPPGHSGRTLSLSDGQTVALVCAGQTCSLPITKPQLILAAAAAAGGSEAVASAQRGDHKGHANLP